MELEVAGRFGLKKFRMEKGLGKMERAYYDSEKGTIARNYMREQKLVCFDLKISGHENFNGKWLGKTVVMLTKALDCVGVVPELAELQNVYSYEKTNADGSRVEGMGQRIYF